MIQNFSHTGTIIRTAPGFFRDILLLVMTLLCLWTVQGNASSFGVARSSTPVLNTSAFSAVFGIHGGKTLKKDHCGQIRELEFIALPGTVFRLLDQVRQNGAVVYRVETDDYPAPTGTALYLDSRFIEIRTDQPGERSRRLPERDKILSFLKESVGSPYVWGGNVRQGVDVADEPLSYGTLPVGAGNHLIPAGLDCSGLLYQATNGWTPRNTSLLLSFGKGLPVAGKTIQDLTRQLEPLDLIVWNGHVIIVLDLDTVIESRLECGKQGNGGVVTTPLQQRLMEIMRQRRPVDHWPASGKQRDVFVVRRWMKS